MNEDKTLDGIIEEAASRHNVSTKLVREMMALEQGKLHLERRRGITGDLRQLLQKTLATEHTTKKS